MDRILLDRGLNVEQFHRVGDIEALAISKHGDAQTWFEAPERALHGPARIVGLTADRMVLLHRPEVRFAEGIERTVDWYRERRDWWEPIRSGEYRAFYERQYGRALS